MSNEDELRNLVARVESALRQQEAELQRRIDDQPLLKSAGVTPDQMVDAQGRPILLDALVQLLPARVALLIAERG